MNREDLITRDDDPTVKECNDLYACAKMTSVITRLALRHTYVQGIKESKIATTDRVTEAVIAEAMGGYDDDDIYRFFNRY